MLHCSFVFFVISLSFAALNFGEGLGGSSKLYYGLSIFFFVIGVGFFGKHLLQEEKEDRTSRQVESKNKIKEWLD